MLQQTALNTAPWKILQSLSEGLGWNGNAKAVPLIEEKDSQFCKTKCHCIADQRSIQDLRYCQYRNGHSMQRGAGYLLKYPGLWSTDGICKAIYGIHKHVRVFSKIANRGPCHTL